MSINTSSGSSYGVKNVHARLQLMFGEAYGLSYESREGEGTCVTVRFPKTDKSGRPGTAAQREE